MSAKSAKSGMEYWDITTGDLAGPIGFRATPLESPAGKVRMKAKKPNWKLVTIHQRCFEF